MSVTPQRVLLVDDEPNVRELGSDALIASGLGCDTAQDGQAAIELLQASNYSAVVTDLRMPNHHGYALCELLLRSHAPPRIMVLTGLHDARITSDLLSRGVYEFVHKPVEFDRLVGRVRAMIDGPAKSIGGLHNEGLNVQPKTRAELLTEIERFLIGLTQRTGEKLDEAFAAIENLPDPPPSVGQVIKRIAQEEAEISRMEAAKAEPGHFERKTQRVTCCTTAIAAPIDHEGKPLGEPFKLALRDLSEGGARLLYTRATNADYLALTWNTTQVFGHEIRVAMQVRRCQPRGRFYDYGGAFVVPGQTETADDA